MGKPNMNCTLFAVRDGLWRRIFCLLLAAILLTGAFPMSAFSVESGDQETGETSTGDTAEYDLTITLDGVEITSLALTATEKVEIKAEGMADGASYQWQVQHPENDETWVDIYDGTEQSIGVSLALVNNVLRADGTAKLRCTATLGDDTYVTAPLNVVLVNEDGSAVTNEVNAVTEGEDDSSDDEGTPEFVTITINYVRYDYVKNADGKLELSTTGTEAFSPYIATIRYGADFPETSVSLPTIVGYAAHETDQNSNTITSVTLKYTGLTENQVITVNYYPANVNYTVRYYFQNIYDDNYVEDTDEAVTTAGPTGSAPADDLIYKTFTGFTSMFYRPDAIAADGSTVFEVYYERNYYLMEFDCDGGYGTDPIYVRFGTYISVPDPIRSGWTFDYWYLLSETFDDNTVTNYTDTDADALPTTMPSHNSSYKAAWTRTTSTFTVIYWVQNANGDAYSYADSVENITATTGDVITLDNITTYKDSSGTALTKSLDTSHDLYEYATLDTEATQSVTVEGDGSTIFNIYFKRNEYTLRFVYARQNVNTLQYQIATNTEGYTKKPNKSSVTAGSIANATWQDVDSLPNVDSIDGYSLDTYTEDNYTYFYFTFTARYRQDLSVLWPLTASPQKDAVVNEVDDYICVGWCMNADSAYAKNSNNSNPVVTGEYSVLDSEILTSSTDAINHTLLAYWMPSEDAVLWELRFWLGMAEGEADGDTSDTSLYLDNNDYFPTAHPLFLYWKKVMSFQTYFYASASSETNMWLLPRSTAEGMMYTARKTGMADLDGDGSVDDRYINYFYYYNERALVFNNYGSTLVFDDDHNGEEDGVKDDINGLIYESTGVDYGVSLKSYVTKAEAWRTYPSTLEPGAYEFMGWYTGPNGTGQKVVFSDDEDTTGYDNESVYLLDPTMPDDDLILFAYWKPIVHDVYFYELYDNIADGIVWKGPFTVEHGELLGTANNYTPERKGYTFVGWFYMDENGKKRFAPDSMEVKKDLHLFAEWASGIDTTYEVTYVLEEEVTVNGTTYPAGTAIADITDGHSTAGKTKTFTAKGATELDSAFQHGFFPKAGSHSILMQADPAQNVYTFEYVKDDEVWYKVRYVDIATNQEIDDCLIKSTSDAVITLRYLPISDYVPMPGYYYQTKSLTADYDATEPIAANVITFYYMEDTTHSMYSIEHYIENLDGSYSLYSSFQNTGDISTTENPNYINNGTGVNDEFTISTIEGFAYNKAEIITYNDDGTVKETRTITDQTISEKLDANGLTIKIYYNRIQVDYTIEYRIYGATENGQLASWKNPDGSKKVFGDTVTHTAPGTFTATDGTIYEYYIVNSTEEDRTKSMTIRANKNSNVLTFYYTPKRYTVNYEVVCTDDSLENFGVVSPVSQIVTNVDQLSCTATPYTGYRFVGWFRDEECTDQIKDTTWVSGGTLTPQTLADATYYAQFAPITLTITTSANVPSGDSPSFLYSITGLDDSNQRIQLMVSTNDFENGSASVTIEALPVGTYKITALTDWSKEYGLTNIVGENVSVDSTDVAKGTITVTVSEPTDGEAAVVTFSDTYAELDWLNSETQQNIPIS